MYGKEELRKFFPRLSEQYLAVLVPCVADALKQAEGAEGWDDDRFVEWLNTEYNPGMKDLENNLKQHYL